jgi:Protein of unknown function (DUF1778)
MAIETRSTDPKGRVSLTKAFANARVMIEQVSENELPIRKVRVILEDEHVLSGEAPIALSNSQRERFVRALDEPPKPNAAFFAASDEGEGRAAWLIANRAIANRACKTEL